VRQRVHPVHRATRARYRGVCAQNHTPFVFPADRVDNTLPYGVHTVTRAGWTEWTKPPLLATLTRAVERDPRHRHSTVTAACWPGGREAPAGVGRRYPQRRRTGATHRGVCRRRPRSREWADLERNAIALLSNYGKAPVDSRSNEWLGTDSPIQKIRESGALEREPRRRILRPELSRSVGRGDRRDRAPVTGIRLPSRRIGQRRVEDSRSR
jgi:hypothetical protein